MEGTREKMPAQVQKEVAAVPQQLAEEMDVAEVAKHGLETELVQAVSYTHLTLPTNREV